MKLSSCFAQPYYLYLLALLLLHFLLLLHLQLHHPLLLNPLLLLCLHLFLVLLLVLLLALLLLHLHSHCQYPFRNSPDRRDKQLPMLPCRVTACLPRLFGLSQIPRFAGRPLSASFNGCLCRHQLKYINSNHNKMKNKKS